MPGPRSFHNGHIPGAPTQTGRGPASLIETGTEIRQLLQWALTERSRAICRGWTRIEPAYVNSLMAPLFDWIRYNQHPSAATLRKLHRDHWAGIRVVMPGTAAGKKRLDRLETLLLGA